MTRMQAIQLFIRVVETGSFSKASADMGLAKLTATKHVAALEGRLGTQLLNRSTKGVTPTEVGALYFEKWKRITRELEEADDLALLLKSRFGGRLRISTTVSFGHQVMTPLVLRFMREHPELCVELNFDDRYVNLVEQGVDVALRMGRLADSTLGARFLGLNPWLLAAAPAYLREHGTPESAEAVSRHHCLIYSSVQSDERWTFIHSDGRVQTVPVKGLLRSNNLSAVLAACQGGMGLAMLPHYVARMALAEGALTPVLPALSLPSQELHAVYRSPSLVPGKVQVFVSWLQRQLGERWWEQDLEAPAC